MKFEFSAEQEAFRAEVREFLGRTLTPAFWERHRLRGGGSSSPEFSQAAGREGMLAIAWPPEYGGRGKGYVEQMLYMQEMVDAGAPIEHHRRAIQQVGPSIILFGTPQQKADLLPRMAAGELSVAMGLSEPNAGSDLASASTLAVREGDDWVVTGQKRFTSGAHFSDLLWTVVRTDPEAPKHRGISILLVPLNSPGVEVRPLLDLQGRHHFNEVFLESVRVPAANLIGEENRGWYVNASTMDFERSGIARYAFLKRTLDRAVVETRAAGVGLAAPARRGLAAAAVRTEVAKLLSHHVTAMQAAGELPNYQVSIAKLSVTETIQQVTNAAVHVSGLHGQLAQDDMDDAEDSPSMAWGSLYLDSIRHTIGQGSAEIQRNVIANRGLGLPRG